MNRFAGIAFALLLSGAAAFAAADTRLVDAAKDDNFAGVQAALKQGADVNQQQPDGATALQWAAYVDDKAMVDALLKAGAKVNLANELGVTPLMLACENGSSAIVDVLLKAGADPNAKAGSGESAVLIAARVGNPDVMKALLAHNGDANVKQGDQGQTALMWAVAERHPDIAEILIDHGVDVHARTALPPAVGGNAVDNAGRYVKPLSNGFTPLLFAARVGDLESAKILLAAGADANEMTADGLSALSLETVRAHRELAMFLLDHGANPNADAPGYTALHWAAGTWESELTVRAITTERENGEWRTVAGLKEGKVELVRALLAHGADPNARMKKAPARAGTSKNPQLLELKGATPLILAAMAGDTAVMHALVEGGADPKLETTDNGTVLMAAAGLGHVQGEDLITDKDALAAAKYAIELGHDPKAADAYGNTALHYAAYMRHDAVVEYLAGLGIPLDVKNKYGETPLWVSELVIQFFAGGTFAQIPSSTSALLRKLGAPAGTVTYTLYRPTDWPDNSRDLIEGRKNQPEKLQEKPQQK